MLAPILFMSVAGPPPPSPLGAYLARSTAWESKVVSTTPERTTIELVSGVEYGHTWRHGLLIQRPRKPLPGVKGAILYITGDGPFPGDELELNLLSNASGLTIAMLFDIPNQPLTLPPVDGKASEPKREDELIAETFARNLDDGGKTPPLLFPMTRAALRAMDAVQKETGIGRFVITGASKRGWTTWLAGTTGDPRIAGIAPMVYDNLNLPAQMKGQIASWGKYSEMIEAYTALGLQEKMETPSGQALSTSVDPYARLSGLKAPVLVVNGTNDRYWPLDALKAYWPAVKTPKWLLEVPNNPHGLNDKARLVATIGAFARRALVGKVQTANWKFSSGKGNLKFTVSGISGVRRTDLWIAHSATRDFREAKWGRHAALEGEPKNSVNIYRLSDSGYTAVFAEATVADPATGRTFTVSSPVEIVTP